MNKIIRAYLKNSQKEKIKILFPSFIGKDVYLEGRNFIGRYCHINKTEIGKYTYIGNNCEFSNCRIGSFCSISSNIKIIIGSHPSSKWISTHPMFFSKKCYVGKGFIDKDRYDEFSTTIAGYYCEIGNDVWIGRNVSIMQGVTIGNGVIIGTNSLITKNVPPYSVVVGSPGKIIRMRFQKDEIELLEKIEWWNWDIERIKNMALYFNDINEFKNHL